MTESATGIRLAPVRVGILLDDEPAPNWVAWLIEAIRAHNDLDLQLGIHCASVRRPRLPRLFSLYERLDRRLFRLVPDASASVDQLPALAGIDTIHAQLEPDGLGGHRLRGDDIAAVRQRSLDVILSVAKPTPDGRIRAAASRGLWALHQGDPGRFRDEPPLFWELFGGEPASISVLEILAEEATENRTIYHSTTRTDPVSLERSRNPTYWKGAGFMIRRLGDLAQGRWAPPELSGFAASPAIRTTPSNVDTLRHVARIARRAARRQLVARTTREEWFLGVRRRRSGVLPQDNPQPWLIARPPHDRYWADPFVFEDDGETLVFFEQFRWARNRGELAVGRLQGDGRLTDVEEILPADHHQSFPYVFRDRGETFMIPEAGHAGRVELFRASDFPLDWAPVASLLEGVHAVDASLLHHDGLYWMWVSMAVPDGARRDDETFLYFSDRLETGWTAHPRNPVVSDARRARPAGRPFVHDGTLIRPAQDCTGRYGAQVVFNAVEVLTEESYEERPVGSLTPSWAGQRCLGAHTYSFDGGWEATDGLRLVPRWRRPGAAR